MTQPSAPSASSAVTPSEARELAGLAPNVPVPPRVIAPDPIPSGVAPAQVLTRSVEVDAQVSGDGRTVEALMVPWNVPATITEERGGRLVTYQEQFARGAMERAERVPHRVQLVWGHSSEFGNLLGRGVAFRNDVRGEVGVFGLLPSMAAKAREALEGSSVSVSFQTIRPSFGSEREGALVTRSEVHLIHLAAVDHPAYDDARVLQLRAADEAARAEAAERAASDDLLRESLEAILGWGGTLSPVQHQWLAEHPRG